MKRGWLMALISANLAVLIALVFIYPHLMVSPGPVVSAHAEINTDCFACHAPLRGASSERCIACHTLSDIGLRSSKGVPLVQKTKGLKTSFHQELIEKDCVACHSDHQAPRLTQRSRKPFSHDLLRVAVREQCASCHVAPTDKLHSKLSANCKQCHGQQAWKPATFDHGKFFVLDKDHNASCETCHTGNDYSRYTCYGCHEHTPAKVRAEHLKEGIPDYENCVECHRSGDKHGLEKKDTRRTKDAHRDRHKD